MDLDTLDMYGRASEWTLGKVSAASTKLTAQTPCDEWNVRQLMNHMLDTANYFIGSARGRDVSPPSHHPPELVGDDPVKAFARTRDEMLSTFSEDGVIEKTGPSLGIAFSDQLLHGWDLARATGQDATMPAGLPEAAYSLIHGKFTEQQRQGIFKPEIAVAPDASAQDKLLSYTGRKPTG